MNSNAAQRASTFEKIAEWLPLVLIAGGLATEWINFPYASLVWIAGFFLYGFLGLINSVRKKYYECIVSFGFLKLGIEVVIVLLALAFLSGTNTFFFLLMLILFDRFVVRGRSL